MTMMQVLDAADCEEAFNRKRGGVADVATMALREAKKAAARGGGVLTGADGGDKNNNADGSNNTAQNGNGNGKGNDSRGLLSSVGGDGRALASATGGGVSTRSRKVGGHGGLLRLTASARGSCRDPAARVRLTRGGGDENAPSSSQGSVRTGGCAMGKQSASQSTSGGGGDALAAYRAAKEAVEMAASLDKRRKGAISRAPSSQQTSSFNNKAFPPKQRHRAAMMGVNVGGGGDGGEGTHGVHNSYGQTVSGRGGEGDGGGGGGRRALAPLPSVAEQNTAQALTARTGRASSGRGWH
jgi:hypothetical protein